MNQIGTIIQITTDRPLIEISGGNRDTEYRWGFAHNVAGCGYTPVDRMRAQVARLVEHCDMTIEQANREVVRDGGRAVIIADDGYALEVGGRVVAILGGALGAGKADDVAGILDDRVIAAAAGR